jgi:hypothetical protein
MSNSSDKGWGAGSDCGFISTLFGGNEVFSEAFFRVFILWELEFYFLIVLIKLCLNGFKANHLDYFLQRRMLTHF